MTFAGSLSVNLRTKLAAVSTCKPFLVCDFTLLHHFPTINGNKIPMTIKYKTTTNELYFPSTKIEARQYHVWLVAPRQGDRTLKFSLVTSSVNAL